MRSRVPTVLLVLGVPFILLVLCFGFYNRTEPRILGFPFVYGWIFSCLFISFVCMGIGWLIDPKSERNIRKRKAREARARATGPGV
jgi:hypothetical protein